MLHQIHRGHRCTLDWEAEEIAPHPGMMGLGALDRCNSKINTIGLATLDQPFMVLDQACLGTTEMETIRATVEVVAHGLQKRCMGMKFVGATQRVWLSNTDLTP